MRHFTLAFFLFSLVLFSCKEEKDEVPPTVLISSPTENSSYNVLESVPIQAQINDNEIIESVTVSLISDETQIRVLETQSFSPGGISYNLNTQFPLSDSLLESGSYYFRVEASDGESIGTDFQYINVNAIPRKRIGVLVSCNLNGGSAIYEVDDQGNSTLVRSLSNNAFGTAFNSHDQALWFLPNGGKTLRAFDLVEEMEAYSEDIITNYNTLFTDVDINKRDVFVAHKEGELSGYRPTFNRDFLYRSNPDRYCTKVRAGERYVMAEEVGVSGKNRFLMLLFRVSGAVYTSIAVQENVADMAFINQEQGLVALNQNGNMHLKEFNFEAGGLRRMKTVNGETAKKVIKIDDENYLISTSQRVYRYDYSQNNLYTLLQGLNQPLLAYDDFRNTFLVAEGTQLREYKLNGGSLVASTNLPSNIQSVNIRYNRY